MGSVRRSVGLTVAAVLAALSSAAAGQQNAAGPSSAGPRDPSPEEWRADLAHYAREMEAVHADLFHSTSREAFGSALRALEEKLPELERHEVLVELARVHAMVGDGHTSLWLIPQPWNGFHLTPVRFYWLADGVYVLAAPESREDVLGGRLLRVGEVDVREALARIEPLVHRDNGMQVRWIAPYYLAVPEVLHALGLAESTERVRYVVRTEAGEEVALELDAAEDGQAAATTFHGPFVIPAHVGDVPLASLLDRATRPLWLSRPGEVFWHRYLEDGRTLYVQVNGIANGREETLASFYERVFAEVDAGRVERLVIDLRHNGGGNNFLNWPLVRGLARRPAIDERGKLFVLISRHTFSAASHLVTYLERFTNAIFAGEPTGARPNHYGDARVITLPNSRVEVRASSIYWQNSQPEPFETREWTPPGIAVDLTVEDLREGRDPVLEAVLAYGAEPPLAERIVAALAEGGAEAAERELRAFREDPRNRYLSAETELNALGYRLLGEGRTGDAVVVFRLNAEAYPESANVWDSLGDGYRAQGRRDQAIESYRRALAVDPDFRPSRENLRQLTGEH